MWGGNFGISRNRIIMMFAKSKRGCCVLETVVGLSKKGATVLVLNAFLYHKMLQNRHCSIQDRSIVNGDAYNRVHGPRHTRLAVPRAVMEYSINDFLRGDDSLFILDSFMIAMLAVGVKHPSLSNLKCSSLVYINRLVESVGATTTVYLRAVVLAFNKALSFDRRALASFLASLPPPLLASLSSPPASLPRCLSRPCLLEYRLLPLSASRLLSGLRSPLWLCRSVPVSLSVPHGHRDTGDQSSAALPINRTAGTPPLLSGLGFEKNEDSDDSQKHRKESRHKKKKDRKKKRSSCYSSSDDDLERVKTGSRKKKKWYASDEDFSSHSDDSSSRGGSRIKERNHRKDASSDDYSSEDGGSKSYKESVRKEMGLEWMLRPADNAEKASKTVEIKPEENQAEESEDRTRKVNPRELNPYLKDNGSGYPEDSEGTNASGEQLLSSAVVGDGGASWRLKALKRAKEQAAREGRKLDEVVEERWGSLSQLAVSVASRKVAPTHAHLHAIKSRRRGVMDNENADKHEEGSFEKGAPPLNPKMRVPKLKDSLSWGERKKQKISCEDTQILSSAMSSLNKFADDGSFLSKFMHPPKSDNSGDAVCDSSNSKPEAFNELRQLESKKGSEDTSTVRPALSANQLAAKVMQLRMKGLHDEADKLLKEAEDMKAKQVANDGNGDESNKLRIDGSTSSYIMHELSSRQKNREDDADLHLAHKIARHQKYNVSSQADDEYDYDNSPKRKTRKKGEGNSGKSANVANFANRILTQQERCQFCFENPTRPKHLVVAIANFTYLSLPQWQPIVPGHCCILTMQHESATRSVDDNVWEEIRNFKKCLIMMFAKQEKDVVFLETVVGLSKQRRHCLVECIPLPQDAAKQAPLYFKKAIDEAEDEWSQHNAKKLIDTSIKGLRASIPKDFPYFHVEFGLNRGFVHVIDDEKNFRSSFGLNVIRGVLKLPAEDMHSHRKHESIATQKQAVASFAQDWEPFNWTKQLD
nr:CWF19-like protein 2 [Ipomoea batatas]